MPSAIAFFPWLESREPLQVGAVRLIPYLERRAPGNQSSATQHDIDGVLRAYSRKPTSRGKQATILEVGNWRMGMEATPRVVSRLFYVRELVAFSGLARRRLFTHLEYCNFHTYTLVVQRFQPGQTGTFAFTTRRRDGGTNQLWGSDEFAFHLPNHVRGDAQLRIDEKLLRALLRLPRSMFHVVEAIREFNAANTDASEVPEHVEMVMMKSAFEWLLGINERADAFQQALASTLHNLHPTRSVTGPLGRRWRKRWNHARPVEAWARDFCAVRAASAHGIKRGAKGASVLSATAHLAFAAHLFPLLVKIMLRDAGIFKMDEFDVERLRNVDAYLMNDPFGKRDRRAQHPWSKAEADALIAARATRFYPAMMQALKNLPSRTPGQEARQKE